MNRAVLILSFIIITYGLFRLDEYILPTLDYFGKFVFFGALNIFAYVFVYKIQLLINTKNQLIGNSVALILPILFVVATLELKV